MSLISQAPLFIHRALQASESHCNEHWEFCALSQRGPFKRLPNEDAAGVIPNGEDSLILVIADGCGGMRGGEKASHLAVRQLARSLKVAFDSPRLVRGAILDGIEQANEAIQSLKIGAACTIAVVEYFQGRIRSYHVGDSMVLVTTNRGRIRYQSLCHSPVGYAVEAGWLDENAAMYHEDRHLVSNVVGSTTMRIEVGPWVELSRCDKLLVASDGLFDNLRLDEVVGRLRHGKLDESVAALSSLATKRMQLEDNSTPSKPDDLTMIALQRRC